MPRLFGDKEINVAEPARFEYSGQCRLDMRMLDGRQASKPTQHDRTDLHDSVEEFFDEH
jgi:hypothetical protein